MPRLERYTETRSEPSEEAELGLLTRVFQSISTYNRDGHAPERLSSESFFSIVKALKEGKPPYSLHKKEEKEDLSSDTDRELVTILKEVLPVLYAPSAELNAHKYLNRLNLDTPEMRTTLLSYFKKRSDHFLAKVLSTESGVYSYLILLEMPSQDRDNLVDFLCSPEFYTWITSTTVPGSNPTFKFSSPTVAFAFYKHPNRDAFMQQFSATQAFSIFGAYQEPREVNFYMSYPRYFSVEAELNKKLESSVGVPPWDERIRRFTQVAVSLDVHGATDSEMTSLLFERWVPTEEEVMNMIGKTDPYRRQRLETILGQSIKGIRPEGIYERMVQFIKQKRITMKHLLTQVYENELRTMVSKGTPFANRQQYRAYIRKQKERKGIPTTVTEEQLQKIAYREHPLHPTGGRYPSSGEEIEYCEPKGFSKYPAKLLHRHGIRQGHGGSDTNEEGVMADQEFAPGPFAVPDTNIFLMRQWIDAEFFHWHQEKEQTFHNGIGLKRRKQVARVIRIMKMSGLSYKPIYYEDPDDSDEFDSDSMDMLRLYGKNSRGDTAGFGSPSYTYAESKDFTFTTPDASSNHIHLLYTVGVAIKAYEEALSVYEKKNGFMIGTVDDITTEQIDALPMPYGTKKLARKWPELLGKIDQILQQTDCVGYLEEAVPMTTAKKIANIVDTVYPTVWDRDLPEKRKTQLGTITVDENNYPNSVDATQSLLESTAQEIEVYLEKNEHHIYSLVAQIDATTGKTRSNSIKSFFKNHSWLRPSPETTDRVQLAKRFDEIVKTYARFGKLPSQQEVA